MDAAAAAAFLWEHGLNWKIPGIVHYIDRVGLSVGIEWRLELV